MFLFMPGKCQVDLDALTGEFSPLLVQNGNFIFPVSKNKEGNRTLSFGRLYNIQVGIVHTNAFV